MKKNKHQIATSSTTDIEEVKRLNAQSGLTYNEVFTLLGETYLKNQKRTGDGLKPKSSDILYTIDKKLKKKKSLLEH